MRNVRRRTAKRRCNDESRLFGGIARAESRLVTTVAGGIDMKRWHASAVALLVVLAASPARAQTLCGPPNPPIADVEPRVREKDFSATSCARASQYLRQDVTKLMESLRTEDRLN